MPRPPARPVSTDEELFPEAGELADHFAFGRCEIIKIDGDRLHLKIPRDGVIVMIVAAGKAAPGGIYQEQFRFPPEQSIVER